MKPEWYFVSLLYYFKPEKEKMRSKQKCVFDENWHLIRAGTARAAKAKTRLIAESVCSIRMTDEATGKNGNWIFLGIKDIWPIYDAMEDGAEIGWLRGEKTHESLLRYLKTKR